MPLRPQLRDELRRAIQTAMQELGELHGSDRAVADKLGLGQQTVNKARHGVAGYQVLDALLRTFELDERTLMERYGGERRAEAAEKKRGVRAAHALEDPFTVAIALAMFSWDPRLMSADRAAIARATLTSRARLNHRSLSAREWIEVIAGLQQRFLLERERERERENGSENESEKKRRLDQAPSPESDR